MDRESPAHPRTPDPAAGAAIAGALRLIHEHVRADATTAYLVTADSRFLTAAMAIDTPLAFVLPPRLPLDNTCYSATLAHHSGEPVIRRFPEIQELIQDYPAMIQYVPYPLALVSVPLRTRRTRFGVLVLRWAPPQDISEKTVGFLVRVADDLAAELERIAGSPAAVEAPPAPVFIPERAGPDEFHAARGGSERELWKWPGPRSTRSTAFLSQFQQLATVLKAAVSLHDVVAAVQQQVVTLFGGRSMLLCLTDQGRLRVVGSAGLPKEDVRSVDGIPLTRRSPETDVSTAVQPRCFATRDELLSAYPALDRYHDDRAWLFLPLIVDGRPAGCCVMGYDEPHTLPDEDLAVLMIMLGAVAQSVQRARSSEQDHAIAQGLQQSLLPKSLPHLEELDTATRYLPSTRGSAVGGDWYDVIRLPDPDRVGLVIGDVEGHSIEAVGIMGQLRTSVRAYAAEGHDPATVLARSNRLLADLDTDLFATCCCMWLQLTGGRAQVASAGHPLPIIVSHQRVTVPPVTPGPPLGVKPDAVYVQTQLVLPRGAVAAMYTDGLLDTSRRRGARAADEQLAGTLAAHAEENLELIADRLVDAPRSVERRDDTALLLVRYEGRRGSEGTRIAQTSLQRDDLQHVGQLRHFLREVLLSWGQGSLSEDMELLVSEVATNALVHARSDVDVRLREYVDRLRVEVRDSDPHPPVVVAVLEGDRGDDEAESGRGMLIVDALASSWGTSPAGRGKTTWFELTTAARNGGPLSGRGADF
ncbi:SpoIIE family protein phosphatase [Streptomyces sp. NPDC056161]|uniref:SpoIIE family protein phosphatase n=1 Tax=Streptomyces sp. NPDC056161 TaxID=3345732 RepID=UPI0035DA1AF9